MSLVRIQYPGQMNYYEELKVNYDFPDEECFNSALAGILDIQSYNNLQQSKELVKMWIDYRTDNMFDITAQDILIRFCI